MKIYLKIILITLILPSCAPKKSTQFRSCKTIDKNNFNYIKESNSELKINNKTFLLKEIKYSCVFTAFYTEKGMYDKFGKWDKDILINGQRFLLWKNVPLLSNSSSKFNVLAGGGETSKLTYASIIVFDDKFNDMLDKSSIYKQDLIDYFSKKIKSNDAQKRDFYEAYKAAFTSKKKRTY